MNKKKITLIAVAISAVFLILAALVPFSIGRYLGQVFTITSVSVFMITMNSAINKLGFYLAQKHHKLLKDNSVEVKGKGYRLMPYKVFKNRKDFYAKNDAEVNRLVGLAIRSFFLNLWIFPILFLISMIAISVNY